MEKHGMQVHISDVRKCPLCHSWIALTFQTTGYRVLVGSSMIYYHTTCKLLDTLPSGRYMLLLACSDTPERTHEATRASLSSLPVSQHPLRSRETPEVSIWTAAPRRPAWVREAAGRALRAAGLGAEPGLRCLPGRTPRRLGHWRRQPGSKANARDSDELSTDILYIYTYGQGKLTHLPKKYH